MSLRKALPETAAYKWQHLLKDLGALAYNDRYIIQVLYDSLDNVGGDTTGMTLPQSGDERS